MEQSWGKKQGGAYGGLYKREKRTVAIRLEPVIPVQIPLSGFMAGRGVTYIPGRGIQIKVAGAYAIAFSIMLAGSPTGARAGIFTVEARCNGQIMPNMSVAMPMAQMGEQIFLSRLFHPLAAGDVLSVTVRSSVEGSAFLPGGSSGWLTVERLE